MAGEPVTVRAYLCILIPLASGLLCHWRYRQLSRPGIGYKMYTIGRYRFWAWFLYGAATANAILFVTWAVT
jgi:hypothetical protein